MSSLLRRGGPPTVLLLLALPALARQRGAAAPPPVHSPETIALFGARPPAGEAPLTVRFEDRSFGGVTSWRWDFGDGTTSSAQNPSHVYTEGGVYAVTLTVSGPKGSDTLHKPQGVIVRSCTVGSARTNRVTPLERGEDFVPITGDDGLGFYCIYSGKAVGPNNPGIANNVGMFLFPLAGGEVLLYGAGYGDPNALVDPTEDAAHDVRRIDAIIRFCLGRIPENTPIRFVSPHGHIDHINADCIRELRKRGYPIVDIAFHSADSSATKSLPGWTNADRALFRTLRNGTSQCSEELDSFASPLGKIWLHLRAGHTPGSTDLVIDVRNDPGNRFVVRGSGASFGSCPLSGVREAIDPHGNVILSAPVPTLLDAGPAHASALGGTTVILSGTRFAAPLAGVPSVLFDGSPASAVSVLDDGTLSCVAPAGEPGKLVRVKLVNRNGQAELARDFLYRPLPTLASLAPQHGVASGGTRVTLQGSGFLANAAGANTVTFGNRAATAIQVVNDTTLQCTTPSGGPGPVDVRVGNLNGSAELAAGFLFDPLVDVLSISPAAGSARGGTRVQLQGSAFAVGATLPEVTFGGVQATEVVRLSDTRLNCTTPAGPAGTSVDVRVSAENGSDTLAAGFRYFPAPVVSSLSPASGPEVGGTTVAITGVNFTRNSAGPNAVRFGGLAASNVVTVSDTLIRCQAPAGTGGAQVSVEVGNLNGDGTLAAGYRYHRAPVLSNVEPSIGPRAGGTTVTLRGAGFLETGTGQTIVKFGGVNASALSIQADGLLTCVAPARNSDQEVDVVLTNANGTSRLPLAYRYVTRPLLGAIDPGEGPARGGTPLTLRGSGFLAAGAGTSEVRFGRAAATDVRVLDDATLSCRAPLGQPGTSVDVVLRNQNGSAVLADAYRFLALPSLIEVVPSEGALGGGTLVVVTGSGFSALTPPDLRFGGVSAVGLVVLSAERLQCTTPPGSPGPADLSLRTAAGQALLLDGFVYGSTRPTITGITPDHGPAAGATQVSIHGANFSASLAGPNAVTFGGQAATSIVAQNDGLVTCVAPAGAPGTLVDVRLSNANGSDTLAGGYRYHLRPTLTSLSPAEGSPLGGLLVTLLGSGFVVDAAGTPNVRFGGNPATEVSVQDDGQLSCRVPPGLDGSVVDVRLTNANGSVLLASAFRYRGAPTLDSLAPASGSALGGTLVTLLGSGFALDGAGAAALTFGGAPASEVTIVSDGSLTCRTPPGVSGASVDVRLQNANGAAVLPLAFRYLAAPQISTLAPDHGPQAGGTTVVLTGSGFKTDVVGPNSVTFGNRAARSVTTVDDTRVRAVAPIGTPGERVDVLLSNSNGSALVAQGFRYHAAPLITALDPAGASGFGGATVTLTGSGFQLDGPGANTVRFGAIAAAGVSVVDDQTLRCTVPVGTSGEAVAVSISNNNGSASAPVPFLYFPAPTLDALLPPHGFSGGGTLVELRGANFLLNAAGPATVRFGAALATQVTILDDGRLTCVTPAGSAGATSVFLGNANGAVTLVDGFTYDFAPTLTGLQPGAGSSLGGTEVELSGGGFATPGAGPLSVRFGASAATNVRVLDGTRLLCNAPPGPAGASVSVVVSNSRGASSLEGFQYHPRPALTGIDPAQGPPEGGTLVTLTGSGFAAHSAGANQVLFGGASASGVTVLDDTRLRCVAPPGPARSSATVSVSNANGTASYSDGFRWLVRDPADLNDDGFADAALSGSDGVYVFFGAAFGLADESTVSADLTLRASTLGIDFGASVASGDLNGDSIADLVVSAPLDDAGGTDAGAVYVFLGPLQASPTPRLSASANAVFRGAAAGDRFGSCVLVRDLNGDGRPDLLVGAPFNDASGADGGAVYAYRGATPFVSQTTAQAALRLLAPGSQFNFGTALASGDVTGDGQADLVVGAPQTSGGGGNAGAAFAYAGGPTLSSTSAPRARLDGERGGDRFGSSVGVGDMDGDGSAELVVGAPEARISGTRGGAVYVYSGGPALGSGSTPQARYEGQSEGDRCGHALSLADTDDDGRADLLCGTPLYDVPSASAGRAYLLRGPPAPGGAIETRASTILVAENSSGDQFGSAVALLDLDGDGRADALVGAPFSNGNGTDTGRVYVFLGAAMQAARTAGADDVTFTGAAIALALGKEIGKSR